MKNDAFIIRKSLNAKQYILLEKLKYLNPKIPVQSEKQEISELMSTVLIEAALRNHYFFSRN